MITAAMPDIRLDTEDISGADDRATVRLRMPGTRTGAPLPGQAAGRRLSASAVFIYRAAGGPWPGLADR